MKSRLATATVAGVAALALITPKAMATAELEIISGTHHTTVAAVGGVASYSGAIGGWNLTLTSGASYPQLGSPAIPEIDIETLTGSGTKPLEILFSSDGYTHDGVAQSRLSVGSAKNMTSVVLSLYGQSGSHLLDTTSGLLLTETLTNPGANGATTTGKALVNVGQPYSLTEEILITPKTGKTGTITSLDGHVRVPDSGMTLAMVGAAFVGLSTLRSRGSKKA